MKSLVKPIKSKAIYLVFFTFILLLSTSCTFMYVPLIPANPQVREDRFLMSESKGLTVEDGQLRLDVNIKEIPEDDWLAVQWFNPLSKEIASDSKWLEVADTQVLSFNLPSNIEFTEGYWRTVVSYQGNVVRQFGFDYSLESLEDIEVATEEDADTTDSSESDSTENSTNSDSNQ